MSGLAELKRVIAEGRAIRLIEEGIYSVLLDMPHAHQYDEKAAIYDFVVGSRIYNRIMWGASPQSYRTFAREAVNSSRDGWILDAGCGSLLFSAQAHLGCSRPVVACDQSLDMLRRARQRLRALNGSVPEHFFLLQADLSDLPFRESEFQSILCLNVLHHYLDVQSLASRLSALLVDAGGLYLTSLVLSNHVIGDRYLAALHRRGWIVQPRRAAELKSLLSVTLNTGMTYRTEGNLLYATTAENSTSDIKKLSAQAFSTRS